MKMTTIEIKNIFSYHAPKEVPGKQPQAERYEEIRKEAMRLAFNINENCPESPEKDEAIKCLKEAIMWANASIAINE